MPRTLNSVLFLVAYALASGPRSSGQPQQVLVDPGSVAPGESLLVTVYLDQTASPAQVVNITASPGSYASAPSTVTVPNGSNHVSFLAYAE